MYSSHTCQVTGQKALNFCTSIDKFLDTLDLLASTSTKEDPCRAIGSGWTVIDSVFFPNDPAGALDFKRNVYSNFLIDSDDIRHIQPADYDSFLLESVLLRELAEPHHVNIKRENSFSVYIGTHLWKYFTLAMSAKRCQISSLCIALFFLSRFRGERTVDLLLRGCSHTFKTSIPAPYLSPDPLGIYPSAKPRTSSLPVHVHFFVYVLGLQTQLADTVNRLAYDVIWKYV